MRKIISVFLLTVLSISNLYAYRLMYAEEYYKLYHRHFTAYPGDSNENIFYLEYALKTPFVNPLNALATIKTPEEWERYRYLFSLHVNLKIIEQYRLLGSKYDKFTAYFYNYPWKDENLRSLRYAESYYQAALYYWEEALSWAEKLKEIPYFYLTEIQHWEDEYHRIQTGDLDYREFLNNDLQRLAEVRAAFEAMDARTY